LIICAKRRSIGISKDVGERRLDFWTSSCSSELNSSGECNDDVGGYVTVQKTEVSNDA